MRLHRMERCHGEYNLGFLHCEKRLLSTVEAEIYRCPLGNAVRKKRTKGKSVSGVILVNVQRENE